MGAIKFHCPHCEKAMESDEQYLGESTNCPYCNQEIIIDYDLDDIARNTPHKSSLCNKGLSDSSTRYGEKSHLNKGIPHSDHSGFLPSDSTHKACPYCGEKILKVAKKCRYCNELLTAEKHFRFQWHKQLLILLAVLCVFSFGTIGYLLRHKTEKNSDSIYATATDYKKSRERILRLLEEGSKIVVTTSSEIEKNLSGINKNDFKYLVNSIETTLKRLVETAEKSVSENQEILNSLRQINEAIYLWRLAVQVLEVKEINKLKIDTYFFSEDYPEFYKEIFLHIEKDLRIMKQSHYSFFSVTSPFIDRRKEQSLIVPDFRFKNATNDSIIEFSNEHNHRVDRIYDDLVKRIEQECVFTYYHGEDFLAPNCAFFYNNISSVNDSQEILGFCHYNVISFLVTKANLLFENGNKMMIEVDKQIMQ